MRVIVVLAVCEVQHVIVTVCTTCGLVNDPPLDVHEVSAAVRAAASEVIELPVAGLLLLPLDP